MNKHMVMLACGHEVVVGFSRGQHVVHCLTCPHRSIVRAESKTVITFHVEPATEMFPEFRGDNVDTNS
jgi:hypothetical protein